MNVKEIFEKNNAEFLKFGNVQNKLSQRADLHAFMLLDALLPGDQDMVSAADHEEIWLDVGIEDLAAVATEAQIVELIRCGVRLDSEFDCLCMFV